MLLEQSVNFGSIGLCRLLLPLFINMFVKEYNNDVPDVFLII